MVKFGAQSIICLELHKKVTSSSPRCNWDYKWERIWNALENVLKNGLKDANGCKIWPIKNESKKELFSLPGDAQETANGATINVCEVRFMLQFRVHLIIHLELHLKVRFKIYTKRCTCGCTKRWTSGCTWVRLAHAILDA